MKKRRILIISASAGSGHVRAAEALEQACRSHPEIGEVLNVDALSYTNKIFRDFYSKFYLQLVSSAPAFLGWFYDNSDEPWKTDKMRIMLDRLNTGKLVKLLRTFQPDVTLCTHFLPAGIIAHLMTKGVINPRLAIVVTDLDMHAMWLSRSFHHYFVAIDETKVHLTMLGLPEKHITVSGIPIDSAFSETRDVPSLRNQLGVPNDKPLILVSAGTFGVGPAEHVVRILHELKTPAQIVVICGKNEELREKIQARALENPHPHLDFKILGYTNEMHLWMAAADLFVGKPGGLTTAEALASHLPMVIFSPIPGQEERNSDHLLEKGIAIKCNEITTMAYKIDRLLGDPARMKQMRDATHTLAKPQAAQTIVQTLLDGFHLDPVTVAEEDQESMAEKARKR